MCEGQSWCFDHNRQTSLQQQATQITSWPLESIQELFFMGIFEPKSLLVCGSESFCAWVATLWNLVLSLVVSFQESPEIKRTWFLHKGLGWFCGFDQHDSDWHFGLIQVSELSRNFEKVTVPPARTKSDGITSERRPRSHVTGNWIFRIKSLFKQVQLKDSLNCTRALPLLFTVLF